MVKLKLVTDASVRVYFIAEGAVGHHALGFNDGGYGIDEGDPKLIFPDASSTVTLNGIGNRSPERMANRPLLPGDFVDLGSMAAGTQLDFFLISEFAGNAVHTTNEDVNADGMQHVLALPVADSPFLILGFEHSWGGRNTDFNELIIAIDMGSYSSKHMSAAPEAATGILFAIFVTVAYFKKEDD